MSYVQVINGVIQGEEIYPPLGEDLPERFVGFLEVVEVDFPGNNGSLTFDRTLELIAGIPTVVWAERAKTQEEAVTDFKEALINNLRMLTVDFHQKATEIRTRKISHQNIVSTVELLAQITADLLDRFSDLLKLGES